MTTANTRGAVEAVWRIESARLIGALTRFTGDFSLAEDVAQEALAEALVSWPTNGIPDNPGGWLLTVGRRRAIDAFRRRSGRDARYAALAADDGRTATNWHQSADPDHVDDDLLSLIHIACHPCLPREGQIALTLRTVGGLTSDEIARLFLVQRATVQARITRAKKKLAAEEVAFRVPDPDELDDRLKSVLAVIYLIFTEGSSATSGPDWIRHDLAGEALRLARVVARLQPDPEAHGLLALLEFTVARFPARVDGEGRPVLLEYQDRRTWDQAAIARGRAAFARARGPAGYGPYGLQASIAACHATAPSVDATDWDRIVLLYEALRRVAPSPIVDLNHAVAVAMANGPSDGLALVDALVEARALDGLPHVHGVRAELLLRLGRTGEARGEFLRAAELCTSDVEAAVLREKAQALEP